MQYLDTAARADRGKPRPAAKQNVTIGRGADETDHPLGIDHRHARRQDFRHRIPPQFFGGDNADMGMIRCR